MMPGKRFHFSFEKEELALYHTPKWFFYLGKKKKNVVKPIPFIRSLEKCLISKILKEIKEEVHLFFCI